MTRTVFIAVVALLLTIVFIIILARQSRSGTSPIRPDELGVSPSDPAMQAVTSLPPVTVSPQGEDGGRSAE